MATMTGLVQRLVVSADGSAEARMGPSPTDTRTMTVTVLDADTAASVAAKAGLLDQLSTALTAHTEVVVTDANDDGVVTAVTPGPA